MAIANWPASLPQALFIDTPPQEQIPDGRLRSAPDTGPAKVRPRSSAMARPLSGTMKMTGAQIDVLESFVNDDLALGTRPFNFPAVRGSGTWLVRFANSLPGWVLVGPDTWKVSLDLEVLPG